MGFLFILISAMAICMVTVPAMVRLAPRLGMIDQPDVRKVHVAPISRVGGIGIVAGALLSIVIWLPMDQLLRAYLLGSLVLFVFGAWDDSRELGHYVKFIGQFIAVFLIVFYGDLYITRFPFLELEPIPRWMGISITVVAMVGMINAINHSDGLDGLAGGESLLSLLVIAFLAYQSSSEYAYVAVTLACAVIGGILGFLRFNTHPAKVFMGDSGSQFLGFTLGFLAVLLTQRVNTALSPALPALFLGLPVIDILAVLWLRASIGMNWFRATRNHIHHRLLDLGFTHHETVVIIYALQGLLVISAIFLRYESDFLILALYLAVTISLFVSLTLVERRGWKIRGGTDESLLTETIHRIKTHPVSEAAVARLTGIAVAVYLIGVSLYVAAVPRDFSIISSVLFLVLAVELVSGKYHNAIINRGIAFITAVFVVYLGMQYPPSELADRGEQVEMIFFASLAIVIAFTVRYARDIEFKTTPTDYLGVLLVVAVGIFQDPEFLGINLSAMIIKSMILLYGCELMLHRSKRRLNTLNMATLGALAILAVRGLV